MEFSKISGGTGTGALSIDNKHIFATTALRDTYFMANLSEKTEGIFIAVGAGFQQLVGGVWVDKTAVIRGPTGLTGPSGITYALRKITTSGTVTSADNTVVVDASAGNVTVTMPAVSGCQNGQVFNVKKIDSSVNAVVVAGLIDDVTSFNLTVKNQSVSLVADLASNQFWII